jgi:hypothetical protein
LNIKTWKRINYAWIAVWMVMLIFCLTPGPGQKLGNSVGYVTLISHVALIGTGFAAVAGVRAEEANNGS